MRKISDKSKEVANRIGVCSWSLRPDGPEKLVSDFRKLGLEKLQLALETMLEEASIELASAQFGEIGEDWSRLRKLVHLNR